MEWQNDYEAARYTYISQLLPLAKQRNEVEIREEENRKRREQMFPTSIEDFKGKARDIQLRAARFLVADGVKQEKMMTEFNWAWRQVQPLKDIFTKDVSNFFLPFMDPLLSPNFVLASICGTCTGNGSYREICKRPKDIKDVLKVSIISSSISAFLVTYIMFNIYILFSVNI